jgi:hypothetical protein
MAIWIPVDRTSDTLANNGDIDNEIECGGNGISSGVLIGYHLRVSASSGGSHKVTLTIYDDADKTNILYVATIDLDTAAKLHTDHVFDPPIPVFETPTVNTLDVAGGGSKMYKTTFFVQVMG